MAKLKKNFPVQQFLTDQSVPVEQRRELVRAVFSDSNEEANAIADTILQSLAATRAETVHAEKARQLGDLIREMEEGPLRNAAFLEILPSNGTPTRRASVVLDDGTLAYTVVPDEKLAETLRRGDRVLLEAKGRALLRKGPAGFKVGEEALFERRLDEERIEVLVRGQDRHVVFASDALSQRIAAQELKPGVTVIVSSRQNFAFDALPPKDHFSHFTHLCPEPAPDILVERDIGAPPKCINEVGEAIRFEMTHPEIRRRFNLRRCEMQLLCGVSGSGKTLAVLAIWRRMYEIMSELTGVPVEQLPPRVFRLNLAGILSKWLGESDKALDRFFAEAEQLASQPFIAPDGREFRLPVLAIMEEIDGVARTRGSEPVYDRILTTALQRLDPTRPDLKDKLIVYVATTNDAHNVDRAFIRRVGGSIHHFGRLSRKGFVSVLQKHLNRVPAGNGNGAPEQESRRRIVNDMVAWLFSPNGSDRGLLQLTYAGSANAATRYRRDFLTGALVDRAVQQAAKAAARAEILEGHRHGVTFELLAVAFDDQIRGISEQLTEHNVGQYLDVPEGMRIANLRRLPQPPQLPHQLQVTENLNPSQTYD